MSEKQLTEAMIKIRDLRAWATKKKVDPWVFRQALIMTLELDTIAAAGHGVCEAELDQFDRRCRAEARKMVVEGGLKPG